MTGRARAVIVVGRSTLIATDRARKNEVTPIADVPAGNVPIGDFIAVGRIPCLGVR